MRLLQKKSFILVFLILALLLGACGGDTTTTTDEETAAEAADSAATEEVADTTEDGADTADTETVEEADGSEADTSFAEESIDEEMAEDTMVDASLPAVINMPEQIAEGRDVEITVIGKPPESQPESLAAWEEQVGRFQAMYPNVTIVGTDYEYAPDSFAALVAGNQIPTLFEVYLTDPSKILDQGIAADLSEFVAAQNLEEVFNPQILDIAADGDGHFYGIPRFAYAMGLAYNIEMLDAAGFAAPPTTWADALTMAETLTNRDAGIAGLSFITDGSGATGWQMTTIAYTFGLQQEDIVTINDDGSYEAGFANGAMIDALNFVHDARWEADVFPRENLDWPRNGEALATERAAMVVMAGDQLTWIRQTFADVDMDKFGFAPLPAGPDGQSVSLVGGNIAMISAQATADQVEAAVYYRLWTQFDPTEIIANFESGRQDPTVVVGVPILPLYIGDYQAAYEALEGEYANLPVENYKLFLDGVTSGAVGLQPEPLVAGQEYYSALGSVVSLIVADESVVPETAVEDALTTFQQNVLDQLTN